MRGRKIEVTPVHIEKLTEAVRIGATYELAARYAGISKDTFERWRKQAEHAKPGTPFAELRERLAAAEGRAAVGWLALINRAADVDWRAASWLLSHRYPEQYGGGVLKVAPVAADGSALQGQGLALLLQQARVIALPSKAPTAEQWQQDVAHLGYAPNGTGPAPGGRPCGP